MDVTEQRRLFDAVVAAAAAEGCTVAPVGSLYFLVDGAPRQFTKDVDAVVHGPGLAVVPLDVLKRIATRLGGPQEVSGDKAVVEVRPPSPDPDAKVELIRGRSSAKGGFFPRALLEQAAKEASRQGTVLIYPLEYVLVLKADAAVDREERAAKEEARAAENRRRAAAFRADVFQEVNRALQGRGLDAKRLEKAVACLKQKRRAPVRALLAAAGAL